MVKNIFLSALIVLGVIFFRFQAYALEEEWAAMDQEELLFEEIPVVITAARRAQKITEAPSTITVVSAEDIKHSGATTIPDVLRRVPGIDVMEVSSGHYEVSARGFNKLYSNKMLVMIDGRSIYQDFLGVVIWETIPLVMEEIHRIEVIKSPGSALYGANAFVGVINIITKKPDQLEGTMFSATLGDSMSRKGSFIYGDIVNNFSYKISAEWRDFDQQESRSDSAEELLTLDVAAQYNLEEKATIAFSGGLNDGKHESLRGDLDDFLIEDKTNGYLKLVYNRSDFMGRVFWNTFYERDVEVDTYELELQDSRQLGSNILTYGGNYKKTHVDSRLLDSDHEQEIISMFLQDELKITDVIKLIGGVRYDKHLSHHSVSPRGSIIYSPSDNHTFSLMAANSHRFPTFWELYAVPQNDFWKLYGNEHLDPEDMTSYEIGYQGRIHKKLKARLNLFYNRINNMIRPVEISAGMEGGIWVSTNQEQNIDNAESMGGEVGFDWLIYDWLTFSADYSYQDVTNRDTGDRITFSPENKINATLSSHFKNGLVANLFAQYVGESDGEYQGSFFTNESYTTLDALLAYEWNKYIYTSLAATNLFNDKHKEFPGGDTLEREILGRVVFKF